MDAGDLSNRAKKFSLQVHGNQTYGETNPYFQHLLNVNGILIRFGYSEPNDNNLLAASFLHDTMEDWGVMKRLLSWFFV